MISREYFQSVIKDHPIPPVAQDPLVTAAAGDPAHRLPATGRPPRVGFACHWDAARERTWSGSAWNVRAALGLTAEVVDIGVAVPPYSRAALKALHTRYYGGRLTTTWVYSRFTDRYMQRALHRQLGRGLGRECEAAVVIDDLATLPVPFFTYYDSSWDLLLSAVESTADLASLRAITPSMLMRRRDRQLAVYQEAAGVIAFSRWHARSLVEQSGVPPEKVHVALPAVKGQLDDSPAGERELLRPVPQREGPRRRLLFVGRSAGRTTSIARAAISRSAH